jgi:hypothetical protein
MTQTNRLLEPGIAAYKAGNKIQARQLLAQVVRQDSKNETAWLWMSGTVSTARERRICLERVLSINPNNDAARRGLEKLKQHGVRDRDTDPNDEPSRLAETRPMKASKKRTESGKVITRPLRQSIGLAKEREPSSTLQGEQQEHRDTAHTRSASKKPGQKPRGNATAASFAAIVCLLDGLLLGGVAFMQIGVGGIGVLVGIWNLGVTVAYMVVAAGLANRNESAFSGGLRLAVANLGFLMTQGSLWNAIGASEDSLITILILLLGDAVLAVTLFALKNVAVGIPDSNTVVVPQELLNELEQAIQQQKISPEERSLFLATYQEFITWNRKRRGVRTTVNLGGRTERVDLQVFRAFDSGGRSSPGRDVYTTHYLFRPYIDCNVTEWMQRTVFTESNSPIAIICIHATKQALSTSSKKSRSHGAVGVYAIRDNDRSQKGKNVVQDFHRFFRSTTMFHGVLPESFKSTNSQEHQKVEKTIPANTDKPNQNLIAAPPKNPFPPSDVKSVEESVYNELVGKKVRGVRGISLSHIHITPGGERSLTYPSWYVCKEVWYWLACQCPKCNHISQVECSYQCWEYGNGILGTGYSTASIVTSGYLWGLAALGQKLEGDEMPPISLDIREVNLPQNMLDKLGKELARAITKGKYSVGFQQPSPSRPDYVTHSAVPGISTAYIVENQTWRCESCGATETLPSRPGLLRRVVR